MVKVDKKSEKSSDEILMLFAKNFLRQEEVIARKDNQILDLMRQLKNANNHRFGRRSEKVEDDGTTQAVLPIFNEAEVEVEQNVEGEECEDDEIEVPAHKRKKAGRKPLPEDLPRIRKEYDIPEEEKLCNCGCQMTCIGEKVSEKLDIIPAKVQVIQEVRKQYACIDCSKAAKRDEEIKPAFKLAVGARHIFPKSIATPGLLSFIATSKFCDHLPLYRQETIFKRIGVDLPRATTSLWMIKVGVAITPLINLLQDHVRTYDVSFADETTVQVLNEPGRKASNKSYIWCFAGGPPDKRAVIYQYHPTRSGRVAKQFYEDYKGAIHCDGYKGYTELISSKEITGVTCFAHVRRKFLEALPNKKLKGISGKVLKLIRKLYKLEKELKEAEASFDEIYQTRQKYAKPILDELYTLLLDSRDRVPPDFPVGKAIKYTLGLWPYLMNYIEDGRYEIDNNRTERLIKPFVIGRKNWLFCQSVQGANASANLFSLIETAKLNQLEPYAYMKIVFEKLPYCESVEDYEKLLPFNFKNKVTA